MTTVLPENAAALIIIGVAFWRSGGKFLILLCMLVIIMHIGFDWALLMKFDPASSASDNIMYYWLTSLFFMAVAPLFYLQNTKLSVSLSGFMLAQMVLCFLMAINGAEFQEVTIPEFESIYLLHEAFNGSIWIVECVIAWIAATSSRE